MRAVTDPVATSERIFALGAEVDRLREENARLRALQDEGVQVGGMLAFDAEQEVARLREALEEVAHWDSRKAHAHGYIGVREFAEVVLGRRSATNPLQQEVDRG
jgi:hypothetical protein